MLLEARCPGLARQIEEFGGVCHGRWASGACVARGTDSKLRRSKSLATRSDWRSATTTHRWQRSKRGDQSEVVAKPVSKLHRRALVEREKVAAGGSCFFASHSQRRTRA